MKACLLLALVLTLLCALAVAGCTLIYIQGDNNYVSDAGGHGGGVALRTAPLIDTWQDQASPRNDK
ncbi:hypothetical protein B0G84_4377 [Paraburkholderia sp. BL8N3]|jgi:hypothetical protein|nr:hypothetical protein [Paraburkholderia sp. BL8N3]TCK39049.1 hypothetical protein B0G84_4377 [Paraburkholderia sp. BL8N3]